MEAVPKLPVISFNRRTSKEPVEFEQKIKSFTTQFYHEDGDSFNYEINKLERLRNMAVNGPNDLDGLQFMKKYYCQLHFLKSRFPMDSGQAVSILFSWCDAYKNTEYIGDINLELMCTLYNIGALHTYLGQKASSSDDLKMACTHYQCAAWCFEQLNEQCHEHLSAYGDDIKVVQFMNSVCLAQAQEFLLEKSLKDNRKPTVVAKIAAQLVTFYTDLKKMQQSMNEVKSLSYFVSLADFKDWKKLFELKVNYFNCILNLYHAQQAEEQQSMAERVAYYQKASELLKEAHKWAKSVKSFQNEIADSLQFTSDIVEGKLKAATSENNFVYHEKVAPLDSLTYVQGVSLVKPIPFDIHDPDISGDDIFKRLIPMTVHEGLSVYSEKKAELIRKISQEIEDKNQDLDSFMLRYKVSHLSILSKKNRQDTVPNELLDRIKLIKSQPQIIDEIRQGWKTLKSNETKVQQMFEELSTILNTENDEEQFYQDVMGVRPISVPVTEINREFMKLSDLNQKGDESNRILLKAVEINLTNLEALNSENLLEQLPVIELPDSSQDDAVLIRLQNVLYKIEEMQEQRISLFSQLREELNQDDILSKVLINTVDQSELDNVFEKELRKHENLVTLIHQNLTAQANILDAFDVAYKKSSNECELLLDSFKKRQLTIHSLISAFDSNEDLSAKLIKAHDFFQKVQSNLAKLIQKAKNIYETQHEQRQSILKSNSKQITPVTISVDSNLESKQKVVPNASFENVSENLPPPTPPSNNRPKLKDYLALRKSVQKVDRVSEVNDSFSQLNMSPSLTEYQQPQVYNTVISQELPQHYNNMSPQRLQMYNNMMTPAPVQTYNMAQPSNTILYNQQPIQEASYEDQIKNLPPIPQNIPQFSQKPTHIPVNDNKSVIEPTIPSSRHIQEPLTYNYSQMVEEDTNYHPFLSKIAQQQDLNSYSLMNQMQYSVAGNTNTFLTGITNNNENFNYSNDPNGQYQANNYYSAPYGYHPEFPYGFNDQQQPQQQQQISQTVHYDSHTAKMTNQYPDNSSYYYLPYGYQQEITSNLNQQIVAASNTENENKLQIANGTNAESKISNNVTYVHCNNSIRTTVTDSNGNHPNSTKTPPPPPTKPVSNIDLLTGIDFSISQEPLTPTRSVNQGKSDIQIGGIEKQVDVKLEVTKTVDDRYDPIKQLDPLYNENNSNQSINPDKF